MPRGRPPGSLPELALAAGTQLTGAKCAGLGPDGDDLFFPPASSAAGDRHRYEPARRICEECPVSQACLERAMAAEGAVLRTSRFGMYGGMTPNERYNLYRRRKRADLQAAA